jgi:2,3,4,5-tetrahydropyridine-2,6-dicarboxylate N-succinyltransferase
VTTLSATDLESLVVATFAEPDSLNQADRREAVEATIALLDRGEIRLAEKPADGGDYVVNSWIQQAILLYFRLRQMETWQIGQFEYHDKIPLKHDYASLGVRVVPPAVARYGSYLEAGAILMPSYVNIGSRVGSGTMVDTWATVGSGAQIGRDVHLAGGVGIGGVLEPPGARPVIVEDHAFIGSRCIVTEGVLIETGAVLGANVTITGSTPIIDVTRSEAVTYHGRVPAGAVVVPGTRLKSYPAGDFQVSCALIIGQRTESTDRKTSLNNALRDFGLST